MIADILTVARKDFKEILLMGGGGRRGWLSQVLMLGVFGIFIPLQTGREWIENPLLLAAWAWLPYYLAAAAVADTFAGERERHTLETLLASRLSDRAILFGKALAVIAYAAGLAWLVVLVGLVTVNVAFPEGGLILYPPSAALAIVVFTLLGSMLASSAGVLISLRAATVRQAAQIMSALIFVPVVLALALRYLPEDMTASALLWATQTEPLQIVMLAAAVLLLIDLALFAAALARFKRARLILD